MTPFVTITDTALNDYCRIVGVAPGVPSSDKLREEFAMAKFVKRRGGAELWRGRRPYRLRFVVFPEDRRLVLASVLPKSQHEAPVPIQRVVKIETETERQEFTAYDVIYEPGFERRVAFKTVHGWLVGRRGEKLDTVVGTLETWEEPPEWVLPFLKQ